MRASVMVPGLSMARVTDLGADVEGPDRMAKEEDPEDSSRRDSNRAEEVDAAADMDVRLPLAAVLGPDRRKDSPNAFSHSFSNRTDFTIPGVLHDFQ